MFGLANGSNPTVGGPVTSPNFRSSTPNVVQSLVLKTNGTTKVNVFGTTNGFSGTFVGIRVTAIGGTAANITLKNNVAGTESSIAIIAKGATAGVVTGSGISGTTFTLTGTATLESSVAGTDTAGGGNAQVELMFVAATPELP